jgi:hypothetical protein
VFLPALFRRPLHGHDQFAQAEIIQVNVDLRREFAGKECLKRTLQIDRGAGGKVEWDFALQTEAAIVASAKLATDHADHVAGRIAEPKLHFVLADWERGNVRSGSAMAAPGGSC